MSVWAELRRLRQLASVGLCAEILHDHQPESVALSPGKGRLSPLSIDFTLDMLDGDGRDPASVTTLPQTVGTVDAAVHAHVRDFFR